MGSDSGTELLGSVSAERSASTKSRTCPHCGGRVSAGGDIRQRGLALAALVVAASIGAGMAALVISGDASSDKHTSHLLAQRAIQQPTTVRAPTRSRVPAGAQQRKTLEHELEASIARDGQILAAKDFLQGPVIGATCTLMGTIESTAEGVVGHYNCLAIKRRIENPNSAPSSTLEGARYFATIDFTANTYTYRGD